MGGVFGRHLNNGRSRWGLGPYIVVVNVVWWEIQEFKG